MSTRDRMDPTNEAAPGSVLALLVQGPRRTLEVRLMGIILPKRALRNDLFVRGA